MGVVYKAEDTKLKRFVALKFLPPELTRDTEARERFVQEAQTASALDHANINTIYEIGQTDDGQMFISMACYEGETLREKLKRGYLRPREAIDLAKQIARGLARAHESNIVHRDIKPANIMVTNRDEARILDFGLAKLAGQVGITKTGTTVGTAAYMSPEQARGEEVDHRTDIWSLGVVLYEMFAGKRPFAGGHEQAVVYSIINEDPKPLTQLRPELPWELQQIIDKALAKSPDERYQSAGELAGDLDHAKEYVGCWSWRVWST
jgi:serine/threonine protein kinase